VREQAVIEREQWQRAMQEKLEQGVCVCACVRACVRACVLVYIGLLALGRGSLGCLGCSVCVCACVCVRACVHIHTYIHTHTHTHTYAHIYRVFYGRFVERAETQTERAEAIDTHKHINRAWRGG
jgi:hypothetical protein